MKLMLEISMNNEAFESDERREAARILRKLADKLEERGISHENLRDINGNCVGAARIMSDRARWPA